MGFTTKQLRSGLAAGAAAALLLATFAGAQMVSAATTSCATNATITAGTNSEYDIQTNEWNSTAQQCITYTSGTAWSITTANFNLGTNGAPATYPSIYKGCHWGICTPGSGLPLQVSKLTSVTTTWSTTQVSSGAYDVAYDVWFNSTPTTTGQPDGTEMMIWLNSRGGVQPFGSQTATASIAGMNWNVWTGQQTSWKIISYVLNPGGTSFTNLNMLALIQDAVSRGSINSANYLIDSEAGFEVWQGGQGLGVNSYSFSAVGTGGPTPPPSQTNGPTCFNACQTSVITPTPSPSAVQTVTPPSSSPVPTATPTLPSIRPSATFCGLCGTPTPSPTPVRTATPVPTSSTAKCSAAYSISSSWGNGFNVNVTVSNPGTVATKTWKVTWTWGGNQSIVNAWNAAITSSGTAVTANNMPYNGAIAAGGNTSFGFQASFSGTNTIPTLTCSAT
jgi:hypothetical protein